MLNNVFLHIFLVFPPIFDYLIFFKVEHSSANLENHQIWGKTSFFLIFRRRLLTKILNQETESKDDSKSLSKEIIFNLVSEPDEGKEGKCEDVGAAVVDLENLYKSGEDLVDAVLDVQSAEPQTRVSKFLGLKKTIGTLTVSILASDVFKSLKPS